MTKFILHIHTYCYGNKYVSTWYDDVLENLGTGVSGYNGDNIQATTAQLNTPTGVFVFNSEIYIADSQNSRVRKIQTNGNIVTIAGKWLLL